MGRTTPIRIVIAYDNYADGIRAWELSERLASRFREDFGVDRDLWKFDLLRDPNPQVRLASLVAVSHADLVVIAAGGFENLPLEVQAWIESWPRRKVGAWAALVASVGPDAQAPFRVCLCPLICGSGLKTLAWSSSAMLGTSQGLSNSF